jgi:hypothetical protein
MKTIFVALVIVCFAQSVAAQEPSAADKLLQYMPCRAWTIMHENNYGGTRDEQIALETWTIGFARDYARRSVARLQKDAPEKDWKNADGADVDDQRILAWIRAACIKNPQEPLVKAVLLLFVTFSIAPDHRRLPPP